MNIKVIKHDKRRKKQRFEDILVRFIVMHLGMLGFFPLKRNESVKLPLIFSGAAEEALLREGVFIIIQ